MYDDSLKIMINSFIQSDLNSKPYSNQNSLIMLVIV